MAEFAESTLGACRHIAGNDGELYDAAFGPADPHRRPPVPLNGYPSDSRWNPVAELNPHPTTTTGDDQ